MIASIPFGSTPKRRIEIIAEAPQSIRKLLASRRLTKKQVFSRPPEPNASPQPRNLMRTGTSSTVSGIRIFLSLCVHTSATECCKLAPLDVVTGLALVEWMIWSPRPLANRRRFKWRGLVGIERHKCHVASSTHLDVRKRGDEASRKNVNVEKRERTNTHTETVNDRLQGEVEMIEIEGGDAVAIGDTPYDAAAAGKAKIGTIGVLCGDL